MLGQPAITLNGKYLYAPNAWDNYRGAASNQIIMTDVDTGKAVGKPIIVGYGPLGTQISPDGKTLYVTNNVDDTVR